MSPDRIAWNPDMAVLSPIVVTMALAVALSVVAGEPPMNTTSVLSKQDLLAGVSAVRSRLRDLEVNYFARWWGRPGAPFPGEPAPVADRSKCTLAWKGEQVLRKADMWGPPELGGHRFHDWTAFNGTRTTHYSVGRASASIAAGRGIELTRTISTNESYCCLMAYHPDAAGLLPAGDPPVDLRDIMASERSRVRPDLDLSDGRACHVVDSWTPWGSLDRTLWIDHHRGFLPIRVRCFGGSKQERCFLEYTITQAVECTPGLWFPVRGRFSFAEGEGREVTVVDDTYNANPDSVSV